MPSARGQHSTGIETGHLARGAARGNDRQLSGGEFNDPPFEHGGINPAYPANARRAPHHPCCADATGLCVIAKSRRLQESTGARWSVIASIQTRPHWRIGKGGNGQPQAFRNCFSNQTGPDWSAGPPPVGTDGGNNFNQRRASVRDGSRTRTCNITDFGKGVSRVDIINSRRLGQRMGDIGPQAGWPPGSKDEYANLDAPLATASIRPKLSAAQNARMVAPCLQCFSHSTAPLGWTRSAQSAPGHHQTGGKWRVLQRQEYRRHQSRRWRAPARQPTCQWSRGKPRGICKSNKANRRPTAPLVWTRTADHGATRFLDGHQPGQMSPHRLPPAMMTLQATTQRQVLP